MAVSKTILRLFEENGCGGRGVVRGWRAYRWEVVGITLLAAAVRLPNLGARSLWFDEALSGCIARLDALSVLANAARSSHPPGYYLLLHLFRPLGASEFALRLPSALCSLLAVVLTWQLAGELFGRRTARLAALGMALSPFQVYYAQEARMYGLVIALSAGVLWTFLRGARKGERRVWWAYGTLTGVGLYVHYYVALLVLALHLWLLLSRRWVRRTLLSLALADGLATLAFAPQFTQFLAETSEFVGYARWRVVPHPLEPLRTFHYLLFGHVMLLWIVPVCLFLILSLLAIGGLGMVRRRSKAGGALVLVVWTPILGVLALSLLVTPIYVERSFAVVTPALMVWLAYGVAMTPRRSLMLYLGAALAALMVGGTMLYHLRPDPAKPPLREAAALVTQEAQATDVRLHLQTASYLPALYYAPGAAGALVDTGQAIWLAPEAYRLFGGRIIRSGELPASGRVWLTVMPGYLSSRQQDFLSRWEEVHPLVRSWDWGAVQVRLYAWGEGR